MKKFLCISLVTVLLFAMASCQKDQDIITPSVPSTQVDTGKPDPGESGQQFKTTSSSILNATSASQISSTFLTSKWAYKNKYVHTTQYSGECSWTSYVLCAAAIINGDLGYYYYPVTHTKITYVKTWCGSSYMERLRDYANIKDNLYFYNVSLCKESKNSTGRFNMTKQMLYHLYLYQKPFISIITSSNIGHYVVVWDIDWVCGGTGSTVYYTDPLDSPTIFMSQVKTMSLTTFLDKMGPLNNYTSSYCSLFLR